MAHKYGFDDELTKSLKLPVERVKQMIESVLGSIVSIRPATVDEQGRGIDFSFVLPSEREQFVDLKLRSTDYAARGLDDLVLETLSCDQTGQVGWTLDEQSRADWVLWHWADTGRFRLISAPLLRAATRTYLDTWAKSYPMRPQVTSGRHYDYKSRSLCVPIRDIARALWRQGEGSI